MAKRNLSTYQQSIVRRYYENMDTIMIQKLGEIVSDLYLCTTEKKAARLWTSAEKALERVCEDKAWMQKVLENRDVEQLASLVGEVSAQVPPKTGRPGRPGPPGSSRR